MQGDFVPLFLRVMGIVVFLITYDGKRCAYSAPFFRHMHQMETISSVWYFYNK